MVSTFMKTIALYIYMGMLMLRLFVSTCLLQEFSASQAGGAAGPDVGALAGALQLRPQSVTVR